MRHQTYVCPTCGATKTLTAATYESTKEFQDNLPEKIPCGWRGCEDYAVA